MEESPIKNKVIEKYILPKTTYVVKTNQTLVFSIIVALISLFPFPNFLKFYFKTKKVLKEEGALTISLWKLFNIRRTLGKEKEAWYIFARDYIKKFASHLPLYINKRIENLASAMERTF